MKTRSAFNLALTLACVAMLLAACGRKSEDASATLATVNGEKITQDQLDFAMKQIAAARPGASAPASANVLESLVEQRLAVQKAEKDKLDRNPGVLQAMEAARKDALARYFIEQFVAKVPKPGADEIKQYYDAHPANFARRNAYVIQKVDARVAADKAGALAAAAQAASGASAVAGLLRAKADAVNVTESTQPAESLGPLLPKISTAGAGHVDARRRQAPAAHARAGPAGHRADALDPEEARGAAGRNQGHALEGAHRLPGQVRSRHGFCCCRVRPRRCQRRFTLISRRSVSARTFPLA